MIILLKIILNTTPNSIFYHIPDVKDDSSKTESLVLSK